MNLPKIVLPVGDIKTRLKKIFLKEKKQPVIEQPASGNNIDEDLLLEPIVKKPIKVGLFERLKANPISLRMAERKVVKETGLSTRQRIKRYNAIMEGELGVPAKNKNR